MAESIYILHSSVGPRGQGEWWRLIVDEEGHKVGEHQWSRTDPTSGCGQDAGSERIPLDEFVDRGGHPELVARINETLAMPTGPKGQKRPADVVSNAIRVARTRVSC
jgi:hypothetical protein